MRQVVTIVLSAIVTCSFATAFASEQASDCVETAVSSASTQSNAGVATAAAGTANTHDGYFHFQHLTSESSTPATSLFSMNTESWMSFTKSASSVTKPISDFAVSAMRLLHLLPHENVYAPVSAPAHAPAPRLQSKAFEDSVLETIVAVKLLMLANEVDSAPFFEAVALVDLERNMAFLNIRSEISSPSKMESTNIMTLDVEVHSGDQIAQRAIIVSSDSSLFSSLHAGSMQIKVELINWELSRNSYPEYMNQNGCRKVLPFCCNRSHRFRIALLVLMAVSLSSARLLYLILNEDLPSLSASNSINDLEDGSESDSEDEKKKPIIYFDSPALPPYSLILTKHEVQSDNTSEKETNAANQS